MTKDTLKPAQKTLEKIRKDLEVFKVAFANLTNDIFNLHDGELLKMDLYAYTVNNRALALADGFLALTKEDNYMVAAPLIRMQLDNALRFFAATLVKDYNKFFLQFINGERIDKIKDVDGRPMNDAYLAEKLNTLFKSLPLPPGVIPIPDVQEQYKRACGYIHLSHEHVFLNPGNKMELHVGNYDLYKPSEKIKLAHDMLEVSKIVLVVVNQWKIRKETNKLEDII